MSPGVNDGEVLRQTLRELYEFGPAIIGCSVVPVGLTEFSKHHLVREPTAEECRAAIALVEERAAIALAERGTHWAFGADELYLRADLDLPPAEIYDGFDQVENGVGAVRWLQQRIAVARRRDRRVGGTADRRGHRNRDGPAHADGARAAGPGHRRPLRAAPRGEHAVRRLGHHRRAAAGRRGAGGAPRPRAISISRSCPASR